MRKKSVLSGILIIAAGAIIVGSMIIYAYFSYENTPVYFNPAKREAAERLFNKVMDIDYTNNYPKTPDDVMSCYLEINRLIYSDMIHDRSLYGDVVKQLRALFGRELLDNNTYESQLETILAGVDMLKEDKISQISYEKLPAIFNTIDSNVCYIRANQTYKKNIKFYWEFQLERVLPENNWKIIRFERTDENYETYTP